MCREVYVQGRGGGLPACAPACLAWHMTMEVGVLVGGSDSGLAFQRRAQCCRARIQEVWLQARLDARLLCWRLSTCTVWLS